jgi:APA family basic amino acid/polyamine antiporter
MRQLVRGLDLTSATALTIGSIIGTGVFFKAAIMSQQVGSPALVMLAWLVAGLMSLCGALTFAELGGMMPEAGGEYVYLRTAYGDLWAFLDGWMRFVVASGGIAALGVGFATFLSAVIPLDGVWARTTLHLLGRDVPWQLGTREVVGVTVVLLFGLLNCIGIRFGGGIQTALTTAKVAGILIIVGGAFLLSKSGGVANFTAPPSARVWSGMTAFGAAVLSALWAVRRMGVHADGGGRR